MNARPIYRITEGKITGQNDLNYPQETVYSLGNEKLEMLCPQKGPRVRIPDSPPESLMFMRNMGLFSLPVWCYIEIILLIIKMEYNITVVRNGKSGSLWCHTSTLKMGIICPEVLLSCRELSYGQKRAAVYLRRGRCC